MAATTVSKVAGAQDADPVFVSGDVSKLVCRVIQVTRVEPKQSRKHYTYGTVITVDVRNQGLVPAEPISFVVSATNVVQGEKLDGHRTQRFDGSRFGRAGRAVRPGGSAKYQLMIQPTLKGRTGVSVTVTGASFFKGRGVDALTIKPKRGKKVMFKIGTMPFEASVFRLKNPLPFPVDVSFLARIRRPFKGKAIVRRRLGPNEAARWEIHGIYYQNKQGFEGIEIDSLKLIDWSVIRDDGKKTATALFAAAYDRWVRWKKPVPLTGKFTIHTASRSLNLDRTIRTSDETHHGVFQLDTSGKFHLRLDEGESATPERLRSLRFRFEHAFDDVRRPPSEKVVRENKLAVQAFGPKPLLAIEGPTWSGYFRTARRLKIADGAIVGSGSSEDRLLHWHLQARGERYVVTGRDGAINDVRDGQIERYTYASIDGHPVPIEFRSRMSFTVGSFSSVELRLTDVRVASNQPIIGAAPRGEGVDALRAAWNGSYRYGPVPVTFSGRFQARNEGKTEALWEKLEGASGTFRFVGYTGPRYRHHHAEVREKLEPGQARRIGELVLDRFRIWFFRDFNGRPPFEEAFAGTTVEPVPGKPGMFQTGSRRYHRILVRDGRVRAVFDASGFRRTYAYQKVGEHWVTTKAKAGDEVCTAKFRLVNGRPVPVQMRFERVFGKDWGPESITVTEAKIEPDK